MAEEGFKRKLTAILSADVEGYSRLMGDDEEATVRTLTAYREVFSTLIQQHNGNVLDSPGDNLLAEFVSVVDAVQCAVAVQKEIKARNDELPENRRMQFRIGINLGDVIQEEERIYGDGVNIAARLEGLSEPGGICISKTAFDHIESKLPYGYEFLGDQTVKNIAKPVGAYRVLMEPRVTVAGEQENGKRSPVRRAPILIGAAVVLVLAVVVGIWQFYERRPSVEPASLQKMALPLPEKPSIAVLPFVNMSGDPEQDYIADGITENIITGLSQIPEMFVIDRNSVFTYKGKPVKVKQVSEELGVKYVLEGSVQKAGDRLRVNAQLIDALKGHHLWAERYDRELKDLFKLQDEITMNVLMAMEVKLTRGESARFYRTDSFEAWSYVVKGSRLFDRLTMEDNAKARMLFERALRIDPDYAAALSFLSWTHFIEVRFEWSEAPAESMKRAFEIGQKSLALDETQPGVHSLFSTIYMVQRQYAKAIAEGKRAIELGPNNASAHVLLSQTLRYAGRFKEAAELSEKALRLQPYYPAWYLAILGLDYYYVGKYEEAIDITKRYLRLAESREGNEPLYMLHLNMAINYVRLNRLEDARDHAAKALKLFPSFSLEFDSKTSFYKDPVHLQQQHEDLRKAGIPEHPPLKLPDKPSIAVLPFVNMSGDQEQEYFSDGISEDIITALSKTPKLFVIARTSSFKYKGKEKDIRTVGRELGVGYVLEGSVRKAGDKVRITAQLIDAATEKHLWAERYDRNLREIFAIQDEITLAIIKAMQVELTKGEMADLTGRGTKNLDAYLKALQAQEQWWRMDKQGTLKAKELALEAIAIDPQYGYPYAIVSWSHMMDVWLQSSESPKESMALAVEAIQKALAFDESDHRIHIVLSNLYIMQGKNDKAISSAQRALELCPGGSLAHAVLGTALRFACRFSEAVQFREQAIKLDPFPTALDFRNLAVAYSKAGRYEDAIAEYKKALHTNPKDWAVHFGMVEAYAKLNRKEEARIAAKELLRIRPDFSLNWLAETIVQMYAKECRSKINDDIEFLLRADVGLQ